MSHNGTPPAAANVSPPSGHGRSAAAGGDIPALAVKLVHPNLDGGWEKRYMLVGDVLVCSTGSANGDIKPNYSADLHPAGELVGILPGYIEDEENLGFLLVQGPVTFTVAPAVYSGILQLVGYEGHSDLLHRLFNLALAQMTPEGEALGLPDLVARA